MKAFTGCENHPYDGRLLNMGWDHVVGSRSIVRPCLRSAFEARTDGGERENGEGHRPRKDIPSTEDIVETHVER